MKKRKSTIWCLMEKRKRLILYCGAGVDVDSGIPAFTSGSNAAWNSHSIEQVCNITTWDKTVNDTLKRNKIWDFYREFQITCNQAEPSAFHYFMAEMVNKSPYSVTIVTSNITDLFERAGVPPDSIIHIHGNIHELRCQVCGIRQPFFANISNAELNEITCHDAKCAKRGKTIKPDVVFYGESGGLRYKEALAAFDLLQDSADVMIMAGSSGITFSQVLFKWRKKRCRNVNSIQINLDLNVHKLYKAKHTFSSCSQALQSPILQNLLTI